nr:hypothetical protein [uncultured Brevundimonas sp.]
MSRAAPRPRTKASAEKAPAALPAGVLTRAQAARAAAQHDTPPETLMTPEGVHADALKQICVMLSPLAPGCEGLPVTSNDRWRFLTWRTPAAALRLVLRRLQRKPDQVALRHIHGLPGTEIHDGANDAPVGCERLLAIIFDAPAEALAEAMAGHLRSTAEPA